jgi:hypothetical protein
MTNIYSQPVNATWRIAPVYSIKPGITLRITRHIMAIFVYQYQDGTDVYRLIPLSWNIRGLLFNPLKHYFYDLDTKLLKIHLEWKKHT